MCVVKRKRRGVRFLGAPGVTVFSHDAAGLIKVVLGQEVCEHVLFLLF